MAHCPTLQLANGVQMPLLGLGTWPMDADAAALAVESAVSNGYRLFDTAESYHNEAGVGEGLRRSGISRAEVFVTSKFNKQWHGRYHVQRAFEASIERLGMEYIDLFLIHWPAPEQDLYVEAFRGLETLLREGKIRAIGTSNFKPAHLQRLFEVGLSPHVNQIQLNPEHVCKSIQALHKANGIITGAYSPLGRGGAFLNHPTIQQIAVKYSKTPSQVVLRWHTQQGIATVAKSADARRQRENIDIFDFMLCPEELSSISALDTGRPPRQDSDEYSH